MGARNMKSARAPGPGDEKRGSSSWKVAATILAIFFAGSAVKLAFFSQDPPRHSHEAHETLPNAVRNLSDPMEREVILVASKFRCACLGCNELPLVECGCNMDRGAVEEKGFIRARLKEGLSVEEVIRLVNEKYGHRIT